MKTIEHLWLANEQEKGLRVRWNDWNWRFKFFTIEGEDKDGKKLIGKLDSGEPYQYPKNSEGWKVYAPGDEDVARAI